MNGETKLHESIIAMLTMLGAEDPLPAARVLESAVKEAIEEGIEQLKAELIARTYPAIVAEPPAQPAFAVGDRVRVLATNMEGNGTITQIGINEMYEVEYDFTNNQFPVHESELEATPPIFSVGQSVKDLVTGLTGKVISISDNPRKYVFEHSEFSRYVRNEWELEPLSEPAPMGAPALPEGVTRKGNAYIIPDDETEHGYVVEGDTTHKLVTLQYTDQYIVFTKAEFEKFLVVGALLMSESEMTNGR